MAKSRSQVLLSRKFRTFCIALVYELITYSVIFAVVLAATAMSQIGPQIFYISKAVSASVELHEIIEKETDRDRKFVLDRDPS